jgi:hypothetical protein
MERTFKKQNETLMFEIRKKEVSKNHLPSYPFLLLTGLWESRFFRIRAAAAEELKGARR